MKSYFFIALLTACICFTSESIQAVVLLSSEGFEAPAFTSGAIEGQQQWLNAGSGASTAVIQDTVMESGTQSLRVDRASLSDRFWAKRINSSPSGRYISIDWDMRVEASGAASGFGPFFGVNAFDDSGGPVLVSAGLGVDATTGEVLFQQGGTGSLIVTETNASFSNWAHYRIELDFASNSYNAYVNGTEVASTGFVDAGISQLTDADIVGFSAGGDSASQSQAGTAYFDNFIVRDGLRGDYNDNGVVDAADYTVWRDQLGQTTFGLAADGNADGTVDGDDYLLWVSTFGDTNAIPSAAYTVPEPTAAFLAVSLGLLSAVCRRRQ